MNIPKIFISSTIYDFKDLRSSLKFWLEELGYNVQLSEFNDFEKDLNMNSFKACLKSIEDAHYFILLIGSRVGGFYNNKKRISITQQEYRKAYELAKKKGLKLIIFVRKEIGDIKNDREALKIYLLNNYVKTKELNKDQIKGISTHHSKFVNDANFIFNFINEVCRKKEMRKATKGKGAFPKSNWVHHFSSFKDIIEGLKNELSIKNKLSYFAHLYNVKNEIAQNLIYLFEKGKEGKISFTPEWGQFVRFEVQGGVEDTSDITGKNLKWLSFFIILGRGIGDKLSTKFVDEALKSGEFLTYNFKTNEYEASELQKALMKLNHEINNSRSVSNSEIFNICFDKCVDKYKNYGGDKRYPVSNMELMPILAMYDHYVNIYKISKYIFDYINERSSQNFSDLQLYPSSPLIEEAKKIEAERVKLNEIFEILNS